MKSQHETRTVKTATALLLTVMLLFFGRKPLPASAAPPTATDASLLLVEGLTDCKESIDLRDASLPVSELGRLYQEVLLDHPELFHVAPRLSCGHTEAVLDGIPTRTVTYLYPVYTMTGQELTVARDLYRSTVTAILSDMENAFGNLPRTEADTILYLHDQLAHRYDYDTRPEAQANAGAYTLFRDGVGICQAYALAFLALSRGAGLEAHIVVSDAMDHAWNHVRVEGAWYHVDVTRDDPIPAEGGSPTVTHTRLLRSDRGMTEAGYYGFTCSEDHACNDTRFETKEGGAILAEMVQPMTFREGVWLGTDRSGGIVGANVSSDGVFVGQVGDVDLNGEVDPADLLALYDPDLPEAWREWMRRYAVSPEKVDR